MFRSTKSLGAATALVAAALTTARAQSVAPQLPLKHKPQPTTAAITPADLMTRLYIFADDSMQGRQVGREGNFKGTSYIAREAKRLGLEPAGDSGTYFQMLPYVQRRFTDKSSLAVSGQPLRWNSDFVGVPGAAAPRSLENAQVVYGGVAGDTTRQISAAQAAGKLVVLVANPDAGRGGVGGGRGRGGFGGVNRFADAAGVATADLDALSPTARAFINNAAGSMARGGRAGAPATPTGPQAATFRVTTAAAERLLGAPLAGLALGAAGKTVTAKLDYVETPVPQYARNVVAILRGSDPKLRNTYVAIGAHNDHIGFRPDAVDHDSLLAYNRERLRLQTQSGELRALTPEQTASIHVNVDSLHRIRPARRDSISNGADDDGSGSMAVLEIAENLVKSNPHPKRSILFVWHTGEEGGLTGSNFFTATPTVPRDSIVTQINIDMIGRGRVEDVPGGGDDYVGVVGSRKLSTDLSDLVTKANREQKKPLKLDYRFDDSTSWPGYNNIYGRSDHFNYAKYNIPIVFFFTGLHADYHQVTDEPEYIDYPHYARIANYVRDLLVDVANTSKRPVVDKATSPPARP